MNKKISIFLVSLIVIIIALFLFYKLQSKNILNNQNNQSNEIKIIDTSDWIKYTNTELGFSMLIPRETNGMVRCSNMSAVNVPVRIFEDNQNGVVYISQEYYYDAWDNDSQKFTDQCQKIFLALESLKSNNILAWKIIINNPKNEADVLKYVKDNFGTTCIIKDKDLLPNGDYKISLIGSDTGNKDEPWYGSCMLNFHYKIIYSPEKHKLMSVALGQECKFGTNPAVASSYQCYDDTMIQSFKFE